MLIIAKVSSVRVDGSLGYFIILYYIFPWDW